MRTSRHLTTLAGGVAAISSHAAAQSFTNGNFETGDLSGWTVANTANGAGAPGSVTQYDIDAGGPLPTTFAAGFMVGNVVSMPGNQAGVELTQSLTLSAGVQYTFNFDWAAQRVSTVGNAEGGVFSIIVNGNIVNGVDCGSISGTNPNPQVGHFTTTFTPTVSGPAAVGIRITRPYLVPGDLTSYVDNVTISGGGPAPCYPNCDNSTSPPILNANDFQCFLNEFAAGSSYANCDGSTAPPVLNANDFQCFLDAFAAGCS